jgi:hypothetical protein
MQRLWMPVLTFAALCVLGSACASTAFAGILLPQQISFDADDIEQILASESSQASTGASSSSSRRHLPEWPAKDQGQPSSPLELANSLPTSTSSSTTSSPAPGGAVGSGVVLCLLNNTITVQDDSPLGMLAEDHGFSLPDPPGTDLLRPPQS